MHPSGLRLMVIGKQTGAEGKRNKGMEIICNIYRCFGEAYGYLVIDGKEVDGSWLGSCPMDIIKDVREEYPNAHITFKVQ